MRRLQTRDPPAFLIDQNRGIGAAHRIAQFPDESPDLRRCLAIARKENKAERIGIAKELPLDRRERRGFTTEDDRLRHARLRLHENAADLAAFEGGAILRRFRLIGDRPGLNAVVRSFGAEIDARD